MGKNGDTNPGKKKTTESAACIHVRQEFGTKDVIMLGTYDNLLIDDQPRGPPSADEEGRDGQDDNGAYPLNGAEAQQAAAHDKIR